MASALPVRCLTHSRAREDLFISHHSSVDGAGEQTGGQEVHETAKKWNAGRRSKPLPLLPPHKTLEPGLSEWEHGGRHNSLLFLSLRLERETDGEMDGAKTKSWKRLQNVIGTICVLRPRQTKHKTLRTDSGAFPRRLADRSRPKDPPKTWNIKQDRLPVVLWANYVIRETSLKCLLRISYPSLPYTKRCRYMRHSQKVKSLQMTNVVYIVYLCPVGCLQPIRVFLNPYRLVWKSYNSCQFNIGPWVVSFYSCQIFVHADSLTQSFLFNSGIIHRWALL